MNSISNIWNHPRTSAAGLLIAIVTIAGVLSEQGISFGKAGSGTILSLVTALATALLGLLSKDPGGAQSPANGISNNSISKLSAWLLIALLVPLPWMQGCTAAGAAQNIVNWTPALQSAVAAVDSTGALLAPSDAPAFAKATADFDTDSNVLVAQAKSYLANPTAGTLAQLQNQVVVLQQQVNVALLQASRIMDSASQQHAMAAIQAVSVIVTAILSIVQSASSKTEVARMASHSTIKRAAVEPYMDQSQAARIVASHYGEPVQLAEEQVAQAQQEAFAAGF